jgi:hypothetical protein
VLTTPKYFRLHARYWPAGLVIICGIVLGYLFLRTYVLPVSHQYQLDFADAKWIEPPQFSPVAYFRSKVFLTSPPEQAWIQVAATALILPSTVRMWQRNIRCGRVSPEFTT